MFPSNAVVASSPKLLDRVRWLLRAKHYSIRTEQAYVDWIRRFILFHRKRHPDEMGEKEISDFLSHLAVEKNVSASTQNQAFSALLFLYQQVLDRKLDFIDNVQRVTRPAKLPVVLTPAEVRAVLGQLKGDYRLMVNCFTGAACVCSSVFDCELKMSTSVTATSSSVMVRACETVSPFCPHACVNRYYAKFNERMKFTSAIWRTEMVVFICLSRWNANFEMRTDRSLGSTFSRRTRYRSIHDRERNGDTTFQRTIYRKP